MKMYKIYNYQRDVLIQQIMKGGLRYAPIKDINGVYFITEVEHEHCGLGVEAEYIAPEPINVDQ